MSEAIKSFDELEQVLLEQNKRYKVALVAPSDMTTLQVALRLHEKKLIELVLIGDEELVHAKATKKNIDISTLEILDFREPYKAVETASKLASTGEIDILIKGKYHSVDFIEKIIFGNAEFCDANDVHHVALIKAKGYDKFLFLTDGFVHCQPSVEVKSKMIDSIVKLANKFGIEIPKVALLAAVEVVYKQMPNTVEADAIQKKYADSSEQVVVEGPLSFDIALNRLAAEAKGLHDSVVAGEVDILVAPNIETANGIYKALSLFADSQVGGVILGGKVPVVMPTEIDSEETRYNSILLAMVAC